jgi:hypothetical protein
MTVREDVALPEPKVLKDSINGVKRELHMQEWVLAKHAHTNKTFTMHDYLKRGAEIAKKIIRLNNILRQLEVMYLRAEYLKLVNNG